MNRDLHSWVKHKLRAESREAWVLAVVWLAGSLVALAGTYLVMLGLFARIFGWMLLFEGRGDGTWVLLIPAALVVLVCAVYPFARQTLDDRGPDGAMPSQISPLPTGGHFDSAIFFPHSAFIVGGSALWTALFFLPMLFHKGFAEVGRALKTMALNADAVLVVFDLLFASDRRVPLEQLESALEYHEVGAVLSGVLRFDGVQLVQTAPAGVVLTDSLREEIGVWLAGAA